MGTSTSSSGPRGGVPFDPPWLNQLDDAPMEGGIPEPIINVDGTPQTPLPREAIGFAPSARFKQARQELGVFARTGNRDSLGKAIGHYSRSGMGGAQNATARMRVSTKSAAGLVTFLQATRDGSDNQVNQWVTTLASQSPSAQDVINEIINQVTTSGGSLEEESCKDSMAQAMAELLESQPDIDLLNMDDNNIWSVAELFLGHEACNRLQIDIGQRFESSTLSPRDAVVRVNEMHEFLKAEISNQMDLLRARNTNPSPRQLESIMQLAIKNTFSIYEGLL